MNNMNIENLIHSLNIMGQGMLSIFVVMFVIFMVVVLLIRTTRDEENQQ